MPRTRWTRHTVWACATVAALLMLLATTANGAGASEKAPAPTAAQIEALLLRALTGAANRQALSDRRAYVPSLYRNATLQRFELRELDGALAPRWRADVDLRFELGEPAPGIVGFQRHRRGLFRLVFERHGEQLKLLRFNPVGRVHLLPAKY